MLNCWSASTKDRSTHEIEGLWPIYFKHSRWWERQSRSKFASHYAWGINRRSMWMQDGCHGINWIMLHDHLDYFQKLCLGGRPNTKPLGVHVTPNAPTCWFIFFYQVWGSAWIEIHLNSIWLRAWSHMTSHYTRGSVTTLQDFGGVLGRPLTSFFWALTISWSRLLAHVWSVPKGHSTHKTEGLWLMHSKISSLVEKVETVQVHFTLEGEGLRAKENDCGWNVYTDLYMAL
jgi:hypothetical protein